MPVNKNLWSLSFILLQVLPHPPLCPPALPPPTPHPQSGLGNILLSLYYFVVDVKMLWAGNPLRAMGMNSILLYCSHEIFQGYFPFTIPGPNTHA